MPTWDNITKEETRQMQSVLLSRYMKEQIFPFSPFYSELLGKAGLKPYDFKTIDDIRKIPFTTKSDIAPTAEEPARPRRIILQPDPATIKEHLPLGKKLSLLGEKLRGNDPVEKIKDEYLPIHFIATTGRTALPTPFVYSKRDLDRMKIIGARLFHTAHMGRTDNVMNVFPYAPHLAFWVVALGAHEAGVPCFNSGGGKTLGTERILRIAAGMKSTVITGVPGYVYHLLRIAIENKVDLSNIKTIGLGAERVTPGHREKMTEMLAQLGAKDTVIVGTYGFTEARTAWIECWGNENHGYHLYPDFELFEIIDPDTGQPVAEGEDGEVVFTSLDWRGSCVLRYRTGDYARGGIVHNKCPGCGRAGPRLSNDITRLSNFSEFRMTDVRGTTVDLNALVPIMTDLKEVVEWQIEITKRNEDAHDLDELNVNIAVKQDANRESLLKIINEKFIAVCEFKPSNVNFHTPEELVVLLGMETNPKEERLIDKRPEILRREGME